MTYRAVLFDLDGTLLDTLRDLGEAMNAALAELGFDGHPLQAYRRYVGDGVAELCRRALPDDARDQRTVDCCVAAMQRSYGECWARTSRPYTGVPELLDALCARGLALAVLSNKPHDMTTRLVAHLLGAQYFSAVLGARPDLARKPDPAGAVTIARRLGVEPRTMVYVGDTSTDMLTARAAGMFAVGALWGFRDERELRESGAQALAGEPLDVLRLVA